MLDEESAPPISDGQMTVLRTLSRLSSLLALLLVILPFVFLSKAPWVFVAFFSIVLTFILSLLKNNYAGSTKILHSLMITALLGIGVGLVQLSPIPTLVLMLVSIFAVLALSTVYQLFFGIFFFFMVVVSYYSSTSFLGNLRLDNMLISAISVFGLFISIACKYVFVHSKYVVAEDNLMRSRLRFNHFTKIANKLARYSPSQVWSAIIQEDKEVRLENKRRKLTVFFSDIKGFTDLSESLSPEDLTNFLNTYFDTMAVIAKRHGGTIDKFIGDALMVFFGDPDTLGERDDALACVAMAVDMRREISKLRTQWRALGFDGLDVRMGINTGYCHVGNFGSPSRLSYTAIGREVNLAARIQSVAQPNEILISQHTYELIHHNYTCTKGIPVILKGIKDPADVWSVDALRQGKDRQQLRWIEHDLPGFNLHLNMKSIKSVDKAKVRQILREAALTMDERIRKDD